MTELKETEFIKDKETKFISDKDREEKPIVPPLRDPKIGLFVETTTEQLKEATTLKS